MTQQTAKSILINDFASFTHRFTNPKDQGEPEIIVDSRPERSSGQPAARLRSIRQSRTNLRRPPQVNVAGAGQPLGTSSGVPCGQ
jgi:hypothetical protein